MTAASGLNRARARAMRRALSPPEAKLWVALRTLRERGFHFRRQVPFLGYILDFACFSRRLVVEVDGAHHTEDAQAAHDYVRDRVLAEAGFRTLRISGSDVLWRLADVMDGICVVLEGRQGVRAAHPTHHASGAVPPPHEGEG